jgi:hypothetical protein
MNLAEVYQNISIPAAVKESASICSEYGTGSTPGELTDCAMDQLGEYACYLTPEEDLTLRVAVERHVYAAFGLHGGVADSANVSQEELLRVAKK